jgi:hypothetical protein
MKTPEQYEDELTDSVSEVRDRYRIAAYLASLKVLSKALGVERTQQIHARAGLLIKSYAAAAEEEKP